MRFFILFILITLSIKGWSQKEPPSTNPFLQGINIDSSDQFEKTYLKYSSSFYCDTLPYSGNPEESKWWKNLQTVIYFPDTLNPKIIQFNDGTRSSYTFFFEGPYLIKARYYDLKNNKKKYYLYTTKENTKGEAYKLSDILQGITSQDRQTLLSFALGVNNLK